MGVVNKFYITKNDDFHILLAPSFDLDFDDTLIGLLNRDEGNDVTFIDVSITGGIGYEFVNGLGIEIRYKQGLNDVFSGSFHDFDSEELETKTQLNSVFQLGISYKFNFSKKED